MNPDAEVKAVAVSEKVFRQLLAAYPQAHREEYGAAMVQLFRDQCRDAWKESRGWGLTKLWLRVLPDVVGTSFLEHLESIKERKFMLNRISALFRSAQTYKFFTVFTAVFLLTVITATVITFILPESFAGRTRINISQGSSHQVNSVDPYFFQTEFEILQSRAVIGRVVNKLDLNEKWGTKFRNVKNLKTDESIDLLKHFITLRPIRNTSLIEICVYSDQPEEAALLANALAEAYRENRLGRNDEKMAGMVEILDKAVPDPIPARPNKPLNITIGIILGTLLGLLAGAGVAGISFWRRQNSSPKIAS